MSETIKSLYISIEREGDKSPYIEVNGVHVGGLVCEVAGQCHIIFNEERTVVIMNVDEQKEG